MPRRRRSRHSQQNTASFREHSREHSPSRPGGSWLGRLFARATAAGLGATVKGAHYRMEPLEERKLFNTFTSFGANETGTKGQFIYYSGQGQVVQISYYDVDFEAVGCFVDPTTGNPTLGDLVPAAATEPALGGNLYKLYVTESASDSYITVTVLNSLTEQTPTPFGGSVPDYVVTNAQTGLPYTTDFPGNIGGVLIGALNPIPDPGPVPIDHVPLPNGLGLQPATTALTPGIQVIPINAATDEPNNFGSIEIGGVLTGSAYFGANLDRFYAGAVVTGDIRGDELPPAATSARVDPDNFYVAGDLREFLTTGPVGTDGPYGGENTPDYITNFDLSVGGKIGEIRVGNTEHGDTNASLYGTIEAGNSPLISGQTAYPTVSTTNLTGIWTDQAEVETLATPNPDTVFTGTFDPTTQEPIAGLDLRNDTEADAQFLGSIPVMNPLTDLPEKDANGDIVYQASVDGNLDTANGDTDDYYAVPFLAGTTFDANVSNGTLAVYDPNGREIATNALSGTGIQQITATAPGIYYFEVSGVGTYNLTVSNVGNMGIGAIYVGQNLDDIGIDSGIISGNGDIGAIDVGATYISSTLGPTAAESGSTLPTTATPQLVAPTSILVASGNLRALIGGSIGIINGFTTATASNFVNGVTTQVENDTYNTTLGPYLSVPNGSVGLVQSTDGPVVLNSQFDPNYLDLSTPIYRTNDAYASAIGGYIQVIKADTEFEGDIATNAGIGTIEAASMATDPASYIDVGANNKGDGIIDLIDVSGEFGNLTEGGPAFVTNTAGDIRYMVIGGTIYRDNFFGGGVDDPVEYAAGAPVSFTDQAGNLLNITPVGLITTTVTTTTNTPSANDSTGVSTTTTSTVTTGPQITLTDYGIQDKGGEVPIAIASTGSMVITSSGTAGPNSQVNIGTVSIAGTGSPIVNQGLDQFGNTTIAQTPATTNASTGTSTTTTTTTNADGSTTAVTTVVSGGGTTTNLSLVVGGPQVVNILNVDVTGGPATLIQNNTPGEIASINTPGVGTILVKGNLGYTTPVATQAAEIPLGTITDGNTYPFVDQATGVVVTGSAVNIDAYGGIGNVVVTGTLQSLMANYLMSSGVKGAQPIAGQFDGIVGPIYGNTLLNIDIGQGVLPTGTGTVGFDGIFATGTIGLVDNFGNPNGDIRGNIASFDTATTGIGIGEVYLRNASIIGANIVNTASTDFGVTDDLNFAPVIFNSDLNPFQSPYIYGIASITISGLGGIIGSNIDSGDIGPITVNDGGFGILNSAIDSDELGRIANISASGYGIRGTDVTDAGYVGEVSATGNGSDVSVLTYPIDVRESDVTSVDPYFGVAPNVNTDLNAALGTSAQTPNIPNVTDTGVIEDDSFTGGVSFGGLVAQKVRVSEPLFNSSSPAASPVIANVPILGNTFPMEIDFPESVGAIHVYQETDGLQITTGHLVGFNPGSSVNRVGISVSGAIGDIVVKGNLGAFYTDPNTGQFVPDSYISAGGPSGTIGIFKVYGNLNANVYVTGELQSMIVTGDVLGSITTSGSTARGGLALGSLHVYGGVRDGSLVLDGNVGTLIVNHTFGTATGSLSIAGNANLIEVGADRTVHGSQLALAVDVTGTLKTLEVFGELTGSVTTGGNLNRLIVVGDGTSPNAITGDITVNGKLGSASISNGNITSTITVENAISSFTINRGDLNANAIIQSQLGSIYSFRILGGLAYGLYGSLLAINGTNDSVSISGNIGDGVNTANITANSGTNFVVLGTINDHTAISVASYLNLLRVGGSIETGAVISAHPLKNVKVAGANNGLITVA